MTLNELRQSLAALKSEAEQILDTADAEDRELTDAEEARWEQLDAEMRDLKAKIEAKERAQERRRTLPAVDRVPHGQVTTDEPDPATTGGFRSLAEFASAVRAATPGGGNMPSFDRRLAALPSGTHQETGSTEGYMVPPEFRDQIWQVIESSEDLVARMIVEPTSRNAVNIVTDESTPWGSTGIQANWRAEGAQMTPSRLQTDAVQVHLHSLYCFVLATDELREDAPLLDSRLTNGAARAITWTLSDALLYGDGRGKPLGFFESGSKVTVAKETSQAADTIVSKNLLKMRSRLLMREQSFWVANPDIEPEIATLTIGDQPVYRTSMREGDSDLLLGRPIVYTEHAKTLGDEGDIQLVSPTGYAAFRRADGTRLDRSIHLYFDYGAEAFRWTVRMGGRPYLKAPVSPANGSSTKSHYVTLAARG
mgnify:CR=1 FL=1